MIADMDTKWRPKPDSHGWYSVELKMYWHEMFENTSLKAPVLQMF